MRNPSSFTKLVLACATALSLIAGVSVVPATSANAASAGISAKKKVLTAEQKKAKSALDSAVKDLKSKEKNLKAAVKAQVKTGKALVKAQAAAETSKVRAVKGPSKKAKAAAKAAAKKLKTAQGKDDRAVALVARRTVLRDTTQAKVIRLDAKYAWLIQDISTLDCGVGTNVTTASGAIEHVWECGIVYMHEDGDTTHVKTTANTMVEVRNIGLQTPERRKLTNPAQCGAEQAYENFKGLMPEETTIVQLRSITNGVNGWGGHSRPTRSVYKLNNATGAFDIDVQAEQIKAGWSLWWPLAAEWAHSKEYLDLMNTAKAQGVGLWNPNLCGAATGAVPDMWFNQNAPSIDGDVEPAFGEYVILKNPTGAYMDLTNWSLRDNSLNFFWDATNGRWMQGLNKFGSFGLQPYEHKIVYLDNPNNYELSASESRYFNWGYSPGAQLTNGSIGGLVSPNYINGEGLYLQDPSGNMRNSMTNPCSSAAMCSTPQWVLDIMSETRAGQVIPIPVALNKVANATRDRYNPVVSIGSGAMATATKTALGTAGFTVLDGNATIDSPLPAGRTLSVSSSVTYSANENLNGSRVPIADSIGTTRKTLYVHAASGSNLLPDLDGLTEADAGAALINSGFLVAATITTEVATGAAIVGTVKVDSQTIVPGRTAVGQTVNFTVYTAPPV